MKAAKETKFGSTEKARDTTLDNENAPQHVTSVLLTALVNQPETFASDLGDDQSRYLCNKAIRGKYHYFWRYPTTVITRTVELTR